MIACQLPLCMNCKKCPRHCCETGDGGRCDLYASIRAEWAAEDAAAKAAKK